MWRQTWPAALFCFLSLCLVATIAIQITLGIKGVSNKPHEPEALPP